MALKYSNGLQKYSCFRLRAMAQVLSIYHMLLLGNRLNLIRRDATYLSRCDGGLAMVNPIVFFVNTFVKLNFGGHFLEKTPGWNRASLVIPFLALQLMDCILSTLMLCSAYIELPSNQAYQGVTKQDNKKATQYQSPEVKAFEMFLSFLTLCSSYVEIPAYLNLKSINPMNYFPGNTLPSQKYIVEMILFNLIYIVVLFYKYKDGFLQVHHPIQGLKQRDDLLGVKVCQMVKESFDQSVTDIGHNS
ncbi:lysosomal-associated transmembrane protein 5 [Rhinophrynus dorsalis]